MSCAKLNAIAIAITAVLGLTACGGSDTNLYNKIRFGNTPSTLPSANAGNQNQGNANQDNTNQGGTNQDNNSSGNNTSGTEERPPLANADSSEFTTAGEFEINQVPEIKPVDKMYYAKTLRGDFHSVMTSAYNNNQANSGSANNTQNTQGQSNNQANTTADNATNNNADNDNTAKPDVKFQEPEDYAMMFDGKNLRIYGNERGVNLEQLDNGYQSYDLTEAGNYHIDGKKYEATRKSTVKLYQQQNSVVLGRQTMSGMLSSESGKSIGLSQGSLRIDHLKGTPTSKEQIQELIVAGNQKFSYVGKAFSQGDEQGEFHYTVDFTDNSGAGAITALNKGVISLNQAKFKAITHKNPDDKVFDVSNPKEIKPVDNDLSATGIQGVAYFEKDGKYGTYTLGFFGDNAAEIAGFVTEDNVNTVGFGGTTTN